MRKTGKKGISTAAGAVLFIILIFILQTTLFLAVYRYNNSVQEAIKTENERIQERIVLDSLQTDESAIYVLGLRLNNTGSITVRIRAVYIDNLFICDPSSKSINPSDTYVNPKARSEWILLPSGVPYNPHSTISVATERGTKSTDYEWKLKTGGEPGGKPYEIYLGPLMLDFTKFYYAEVNYLGYVTSEWRPGWYVEAGTGSIAWKITVKNVDYRNITINQFSVFTLVPNDQPSSRRPWYIQPPTRMGQPSLTQRIDVNKTEQIIYKWTTPLSVQIKPQSIYATVCRTRIFLTFFGIFHELDGTTKPYGQTIPFEAVLVEKPENAIVTVTASPTVLPLGSSMNSTITAIVTRNGNPVTGANVSFTATAGRLYSLWAITDVNGIARVNLSALSVTSPADSLVTATWATTGMSSSTTVRFMSITVTASPIVLPADSRMNSTITARLIATTPVVGANVSFTTTAGTLWSSWALTNATSIATAYLEAGIAPATATVTSTWMPLSGSTTVRFESLTVALSSTTPIFLTDSTMKSTITALVKLGGNPVAAANVTFTTDGGSLSPAWALTDSSGKATTTLYTLWMNPADINVTGTWTTFSNTITVRFPTFFVKTEKASYYSNQTVHIYGFLRHLNGTPIEGATVTIEIYYPNGSLFKSNDSITDISGMFICDPDLIDAPIGTYNIIAKYQTEQASTTFEVVG